MLYHLFQYLDRSYDLPGAGMFQYISFRSALAVILALLITITFGQGIIRFMQRRQIGEEIRNLGLEGQLQKRGTPTMGGVMILLAVLVPVLLFGRLDNIYIQLMIVSTVWLGLLGFLDDYITGDKYFKINAPQHNLVRTRCQIALAKDMQKKMNAMNAIVRDCWMRYRGK